MHLRHAVSHAAAAAAAAISHCQVMDGDTTEPGGR